MDARELVDAQFDRAVEIVQGLPKNGPIQTEYEEKLNMYRYADCLIVSSQLSESWISQACINKVFTLRLNKT